MSSVSRAAAFNFLVRPEVIGRASWLLLGCAVLFSLSRTMGRRDIQVADFGAYYHAAQAVCQGELPYTIKGPISGAFVYSPAFACLFTPLQFLDYLWACRVWTLINWGLCLASLALALYLALDREWRAKPPWDIIWLTLLATENYFWANVRVGQAGVLMTAACLGWAVCRRHGQPFLGGVLLACACAVKIAPALLLPYLVLRRDWRGLAGAAAGGLALIVLPVFWFGWQGTIRLHEDWAEQTLRTQVPSQTFRLSNQSILGQLARLPAFSNGQTCYSLENLQALQSWYPCIVLGLAALLYGGIAWHGRMLTKPGDAEGRRQQENLHLCLLFIFMTLSHPRAWSCNFVALLLPTIILAETVCHWRPGWRVALIPILLMVLASAMKAPNQEEWTWLAWMQQGKNFWAALGVALACYWVRTCAAEPPWRLSADANGSFC